MNHRNTTPAQREESKYRTGYGIVMAWNDRGSDIAEMIFDDQLRRVFKYPKSLAQKRLPREEYMQLSNSQKRKLNERLDHAANVAYDILDEQRGIIGNVRPAEKRLAYGCNEFGLGLRTLCVIKPSEPRECWTHQFGMVPADERLLQTVMPNVPMAGFVGIDTNFDYDSGDGLNVDNFEPKCELRLLGFTEVDHENAEVVFQTPWNSHRSPAAAVAPDAAEDVIHPRVPVDEFEEFMQITADERTPKQYIHDNGFYVTSDELYCNKLGRYRIAVPWVRETDRPDHLPGSLVKFSAYYCEINACYVVYKVRDPQKPVTGYIVEAPGGEGAYYTFKALVHFAGMGGYYKGKQVGFVYDLDRVLLGYDVHSEHGIWVYVRPWKRNGMAHFVVHSLAEEEYSDGIESLRISRPIESIGFVMNASGDVYVKPLSNTRVILPARMRSEFRVGDWIFVRAVYNESRREYDVDRAKLDGIRSRLECSQMAENRLTFRVNVKPYAEDFFYHDDVGIVETDNNKLEMFARFWRRPIDVWVTDNMQAPEAQARLYIASDRRPGDLVRLRADGEPLPPAEEVRPILRWSDYVSLALKAPVNPNVASSSLLPLPAPVHDPPGGASYHNMMREIYRNTFHTLNISGEEHFDPSKSTACEDARPSPTSGRH
ncbi:hypothetical protein AAVH_06035 [Aphelenchoides avenae]|nr:hypothetical protein AAVH_06035 [Aphelenchus avenae]